jgi:hypothetical protein
MNAFGPWWHHHSEKGLGPWDRANPADHQDTVRVACLWFIYASDRIWGKVQGIESGGRDLTKWDGSDWRKAEWDRWKEGLKESHVKLRNQSTKKLIKEAIERIEQSERRCD